MVEANGGSITYAQAVRALKARNAAIRKKREAEATKAESVAAAINEDLVKPSELAKELGIHMSVLYGMIKRGTIRNHRNVSDTASMVSRTEVEAARRGGRKARSAQRAAGITDEPRKSPLKKGQLTLTRRTSLSRTGPEGAQTTARIVQDILTDSETGMAVMLDSTGREMFYTADDIDKMLTDGRLLEVNATFLLDAIGRHMVVEGHDEYASRLGEFAANYQIFLDSLKARKKKIKVRKVSGTFEDVPDLTGRTKVTKRAAEADDVEPPRKMTFSERQQARRLARRAEDTKWAVANPRRNRGR